MNSSNIVDYVSQSILNWYYSFSYFHHTSSHECWLLKYLIQKSIKLWDIEALTQGHQQSYFQFIIYWKFIAKVLQIYSYHDWILVSHGATYIPGTEPGAEKLKCLHCIHFQVCIILASTVSSWWHPSNPQAKTKG